MNNSPTGEINAENEQQQQQEAASEPHDGPLRQGDGPCDDGPPPCDDGPPPCDDGPPPCDDHAHDKGDRGRARPPIAPFEDAVAVWVTRVGVDGSETTFHRRFSQAEVTPNALIRRFGGGTYRLSGQTADGRWVAGRQVEFPGRPKPLAEDPYPSKLGAALDGLIEGFERLMAPHITITTIPLRARAAVRRRAVFYVIGVTCDSGDLVDLADAVNLALEQVEALDHSVLSQERQPDGRGAWIYACAPVALPAAAERR